MDPRLAAMLLLAVAVARPAWAVDDRFGPADLDRIADLAEPDLPDGEFVVYPVTVTERDADARQSDLWGVRYDGRERVQLTATPAHDESQPRWSPDGRSIAFLLPVAEEAPRLAEPLPKPAGAEGGAPPKVVVKLIYRAR